MSEFSPPHWERPDAGHWPLSLPLLALRRDHARTDSLLLERCFEGEGARWSDALISRMRRHIGGCVVSVESALRLRLASAGEEGRALVAALPDAVAWKALHHQPELLGPRLIGHFRDRAAISLMVQDEFADGGESYGLPPDPLFPEGVAADISALALAERRWVDQGPDDLPMAVDLPAEDMEQLVWTLLALIADGSAVSRSIPLANIVALADHAGRAVLSSHDEQTAPFVMASLFAHRLRGAGVGDDHLLWLARKRHILALLGILADRNRLDCALLVDRVVEGPEHLLFQLCRAADFPREVAVRLMLGRKGVARGVEDWVLVEYADEYDRLSREDAALAVAPLGFSACFREKLALLRDHASADGRTIIGEESR